MLQLIFGGTRHQTHPGVAGLLMLQKHFFMNISKKD